MVFTSVGIYEIVQFITYQNKVVSKRFFETWKYISGLWTNYREKKTEESNGGMCPRFDNNVWYKLFCFAKKLVH